MKKVKCLVVDDEELARTLIKEYLGMFDDFEVVGACSDGVEAMNFLNKNDVDVAFLDIQMPRLKGNQLASSIGKNTLTIFTTAYTEYAVESYELDAFDYLVKPIRLDRFSKTLEKIRQHFSTPLAGRKASEVDQTLVLKSGYDLYKVRLDHILYIEGMKEYVAYHTLDKRILVYQSLKSLEQSLPKEAFMRVHRSYIVRCDRVESMINKALMIRGKQIPVGERYVQRVKEVLFR